MKDEKLAVCRKHWTCFVVPGFFAIIFFFGFIDDPKGESAIFMLIIGILIAAYSVIQYMTTYISLTQTQIIGHVGVIRSRTLLSPIVSIKAISVENGLLGKIFRYHKIKVNTTGGMFSTFTFSQMAHATEFVEMVNNKISEK